VSTLLNVAHVVPESAQAASDRVDTLLVGECMNTIAATDVARLRWRCRRGTQELDLLLLRFVSHRLPDADAAELATFERLLDREDHELQRWFLAYADCPDPELAGLVDAIRALPVA
jgi:antitoxin CptB